MVACAYLALTLAMPRTSTVGVMLAELNLEREKMHESARGGGKQESVEARFWNILEGSSEGLLQNPNISKFMISGNLNFILQFQT